MHVMLLYVFVSKLNLLIKHLMLLQLQYIPLNEQLGYFEQTKEQLNTLLGLDEAKYFINNALYTMVVGSNDFLDNYLFPIHTTNEPNLPPEDFIVKIITSYKQQLKGRISFQYTT